MDLHCNHMKAGCTACGKAEEKQRVLLLIEATKASYKPGEDIREVNCLSNLQSKVQEDTVFISNRNLTEMVTNAVTNTTRTERERITNLIGEAEDALEGWRLDNNVQSIEKVLSVLKKHVNSDSTTLF